MQNVTSKDGTIIAFDKSGAGPAVILVDGALQYRILNQGMAPLANLLSQNFTVFHYDRRGRGDSTDAQPYAVKREIEDLEAVIDHAGGSAFVYGKSSGAALAMEAAVKLDDKIKKLAMYEPPYNDDKYAQQAVIDYNPKLKELLAAGRNGDALELFLMLTGMSKERLVNMRQDPLWSMWEAVTPTLAYDAAIMGEDSSVPIELAARVYVPTLIMDGEKGQPFMHITAMTLADTMPHAQHRTLKGQTHDVDPKVLAPVLIEFLTD